MHLENLTGAKFKRICGNFPNIAILTKSATLVNIQVTIVHATVGDKSLRETITAFALAGSLESLIFFSINSKRAFFSAVNKICLQIMEVLLCDVIRDLLCSKKLCDWLMLNTFLLPKFLTETSSLKVKRPWQRYSIFLPPIFHSIGSRYWIVHYIEGNTIGQG